MEVREEHQRHGGQGEQRGQGRQRLVGLDRSPDVLAEADRHGGSDADELERDEEESAQQPDAGADQQFRTHRAEKLHGGAVRHQRADDVDLQGRQGQRDRDRDEQPDLDRDVRTGETRHDHQTGADAAEHHEGREDRDRRRIVQVDRPKLMRSCPAA